jgi:predicted  nucleic acid-binding Zn-ribbon protein
MTDTQTEELLLIELRANASYGNAKVEIPQWLYEKTKKSIKELSDKLREREEEIRKSKSLLEDALETLEDDSISIYWICDEIKAMLDSEPPKKD